jgi:hypothetical protein
MATKRPKYLSTDNDPWYRFHQWLTNLRALEVTEIKTVPYVPLSHPFDGNPEELVNDAKARTRMSALQHSELLAEDQVLQD